MAKLVSVLVLNAVGKQNGLANWLENHLLACPIKQHFHLDCPGCGMQRSLLALLQGDVYQSLTLHPAILPLTVLILFTLVHLKADFKFGAMFIKMLFVGIAIIIVIKYIYKIYNHQLFN